MKPRPYSKELERAEQILSDFWNGISKITFTAKDWNEVIKLQGENKDKAKQAILSLIQEEKLNLLGRVLEQQQRVKNLTWVSPPEEVWIEAIPTHKD